MIKSKGPQDFDPLAPGTFDSPYDVYAIAVMSSRREAVMQLT